MVNEDIYSANFKEFKDGKYKTIAIFSKRARGMMARYIIDNNINDINSLKSFNIDGYVYHENLSTEKELIFVR